MNDVRFDLRIGSTADANGIRGTAYITGSSEKGPTGFVIVGLATGQAWRKLDNTDSVKPKPGFLMFAEGCPLYKTEAGQRLSCHFCGWEQVILLSGVGGQIVQRSTATIDP